MKIILAVLALGFMIPVAQAQDDDQSSPPPPTDGTLCIQTIEGPTVCR